MSVADGLRAAMAAHARGEFAHATRILHDLRTRAAEDGPVMAAQVSIVEGEVALESGSLDVATQRFQAGIDALFADPSDDAFTVRAYAVRRLAGAYRQAGHLDLALRVLDEALADAVERHGPGSDAAADVHNELGVLLKARGDYPGALAHYQALLATEPGGIELAVLCHNLGGIHLALGDPATALDWARRGIAIRSELDDPAGLTLDRAALAPILIAVGEFAEAEAVLADVLAQHVARYGAEHYEVAVARHNLGGLLARQGRWPEAYQEFQHALTIKATVLGPDHPALATTRRNLAVVAASLRPES